MEVTGSRDALREVCEEARRKDLSVGFVPTLGSLHEGHLSLARRAREECDFAVMSIFVNPLQFGPNEDLASYPRHLGRDAGLAEEVRIDLLFTPDEAEMYPHGRGEVTVDPGPLGDRLEGVSRPGHFRGVCTVVAKLFDLVGPCRAYFGEKDAQQLVVIRRMVGDLDMPVEVVGCPTVREPDGLAMSSRNIYLSEEERGAALSLSRALFEVRELVAAGERDPRVLRARMQARIEAEPLATLDYVAVVEDRTFEDVVRVTGPTRALVAARVGKARLIDNVLLSVED
ncbi:MAG TPA: pantoate--beta-alanine ligase [Actinomycetota bacterium]|nr:pantoate--beta-alanine ligase [Actinomycetota bacterium]